MNDAQNNGNGGMTVTLGPTDKFLIIKVDEATKSIIVSGSEALSENEIIDILWVAMTQAINSLKQKAESKPPGRIITLPPGSRLTPSKP